MPEKRGQLTEADPVKDTDNLRIIAMEVRKIKEAILVLLLLIVVVAVVNAIVIIDAVKPY